MSPLVNDGTSPQTDKPLIVTLSPIFLVRCSWIINFAVNATTYLGVNQEGWKPLESILFAQTIRERLCLCDAMTEPLRPGLQPVSHLKAGPTTSSSRSTALHAPTQSPIAQPPSRFRTQRASGREDTTDTTSDKATLALIRRVLCPQTSSHGASPRPAEDLLPPLTSSNDVDRQLYAFLAIIIKEFVYSWYSKITPDQALVNEILQVVAHCTRALEQRIRQVDVAQLILDEIPALVEAHIHCKTRLSCTWFWRLVLGGCYRGNEC